MSCSGCLKAIKDEKAISCSSQNCGKKYHIACAAASHLTREQVKNWICPECSVSAKKGGDNSNTPIRPTENVTLRKKTYNSPGFPLANTGNEPLVNKSDGSMLSLLAEIRHLRQDMAKMQSDFACRFDGLTVQILNYETRLQFLEDKEKENAALKLQVSALQDRISKQFHEALRSDLEILGLTETPNENPYHLVLTTANKAGVELDERDLDYVSRAGPRFKDDRQDRERLPRPLVVSFTRRTKREEFLRQAKARRSLESKDVVGTGPERKIYVNERLTQEKRQLFRTTRLWSKDNGYRYCWIRSGSIYIRKGEGRDGNPPIQIRSQEDLQKISVRREVLS